MTDLSSKVLQLTTLYIGPAAEKFLQRQTTGQMGGLNFNELEKKHLPDLAR
jgi:hypothetical protein